MLKSKSFFYFFVLLCFSSTYSQTISVVDNKGTIKLIDNSKWTDSGAAIYNKNDRTVVIGPADTVPLNANASLQFTSTTKGILIPRIELVQLSNPSPFASLNATDEGILVYNTKLENDVTPGFYYWDKTIWKPFNGSIAMAIKTISGSYAANFSDYTIFCDASNGGFNLTLPAASSCTGKIYVIRKIDDTTNVIAFNNVIKYTESTSISTLNYVKTIHIQSNGISWYIID